MQLKIVFWSPVDPIIDFYVRNNLPAQHLAEKYSYYLGVSGDMPDLRGLYPKAIQIRAPNHQWEKGILVLKRLLEDKPDVVIRLDMDALVFDLPWLLTLAQTSFEHQTVLGNGTNYDTAIKTPIMGGCTIAPASPLYKLPLNPAEAYNTAYSIRPDLVVACTKMFTAPFCTELQKVGAKIMTTRTLEEAEDYSGTAPVWHPLRKGNNWNDRIEQFTRQLLKLPQL